MKWITTKYKGIRFREHASRRHGVGEKDKYFVLRYQLGGVRREESLGWSSEGWSVDKALQELSELKKNYRLGEGKPTSLEEKREIAKEQREKQEEAKKKAERDSVSFGTYFTENYLPRAALTKKSGSLKAEKILGEKWLKPVVGEMPFKKIFPLHLERIKKNMADKRKSARTVEYALAVFRQAWNAAKTDRLIDRDSPSREIKKPKADNRRLRFLSHEEADLLLKTLKEISEQTHDMALISLHCGLRAGEIFGLKWSDVNLSKGILTLRDTKSGRTGTSIMTEAVKMVFLKMTPGAPNDLVFESRTGKKIQQISNTFDRAVDKLKLNDGITDRRQRIVFHSLRHSFASFLVEGGENIFTVKELLRHQTLAMAERYSHVAESALQAAVKRLEEGMKPKKKGRKALRAVK